MRLCIIISLILYSKRQKMKSFRVILLLQLIYPIALPAQSLPDSIPTVVVGHDSIRQMFSTVEENDTVTEAICSAEIPPHTQLHTFRTDVTFTSIPWITASILLRKNRKDFRYLRNKFVYEFHNEADNYSQFLPFAAATALKAAGYEGRSN